MGSEFPLLMKEFLHFLKAQSPVSSEAIEAGDHIMNSRGRNYQITLRNCKTGTGVILPRSPNYVNLLFIYLVCEAIGTATTPGLLRQPRVIMKMIMEKQMECR
jgi:hypothetical protein